MTYDPLMDKRRRKIKDDGRPSRSARVMQIAPPAPPSDRQVKRELRAILQATAEELSVEVLNWVREGATDSPLAAVAAFTQLAEYCLPKLQRVESVQKPPTMTREEVEMQLRAIGLDPAVIWKSLG
jgi:hypothetical protein